MSELCITQKLLFQRLESLYTNTKKSPKTRLTRGYLETRLETLEDIWKKYTEQHDEIITSLNEETLKKISYDADTYFQKAEDNYLDLKSFIKDHIIEISKSDEKSTDTKDTSSECKHISKPKSKLPPISLPKFSGNYNDWMGFRDLFRSLIHNDANLSKVEKHHYLRSSLCGEADQLLKHLAVTEANYDKAWEAIENRFNNKRIIVKTILNRLLHQRGLLTENGHGIKELLDTTRECLNSLDNLEIDTSSWDAIVVHIVVSKLDNESHKLWEQSLGSSQNVPTFKDFASYLESRFRTIEMIESTNKQQSKPQRDFTKPQFNVPKSNFYSKPVAPIKTFATEINTSCSYCTQGHYICHCKDFANLEVTQRQDFARKNGICFNCLVKGHTVTSCRQPICCKKCGRRHHTLLHNTYPMKTTAAPETPETTQSEEKSLLSMKNEMSNNQDVLLATARIAIISKDGSTHYLRALIDPGSQASFITEAATQLLGLDKKKAFGRISGIEENKTITSKATTTLKFHSVRSLTPMFYTEAYVLGRLTSLLPSQEYDINCWTTSEKLELADPDFYKPGFIDILLGADVHSDILKEGIRRHKSLIAVNSHLGWLISGKISKINSQPRQFVVNHYEVEVDYLLRRFWELEEQPTKKLMTKLERQCEENYKNTHKRNPDGRYEVRLPFENEDDPKIGDSKPLAVRRLLQMEKKFIHRPELKEEYCKFMKQYELLGHMELIHEEHVESEKKEYIKNDNTQTPKKKVYYLPHHAVLREASISTKLRVVFDGSAKPENGKALNEELLTGPPLLQDLRDLVTRWRQHKIALVADIKQMYRQILVSHQDTDFQRIIWREDPTDNMKEYRLLTVTYGTSCAPYLACRTLLQLADDEELLFGEEVKLLRTDFYMDDLMSGACTETRAIELQKRLTELFQKGGFPLHKWASNSDLVLDQIRKSEQMSQSSVNIQLDESVKALGVLWKPKSDTFELKINSIENNYDENVTKRNVLSSIAKTFDPLGWLAPITIVGKIYMQKLWLAGLDWDELLPDNLKDEWFAYYTSLKNMNVVHMPRWLGTCNTNDTIQLHGFCDASCTAYAAVLYLRVVTNNGIDVRLITAKTKVAPVKRVTLPRLELCGAVLLAKLLEHTREVLKIDKNCCFAWTDSTIVLAWLRKNPNTWKTFVANRTTEILNVTNSNQWQHVKSGDNPADSASRGVSPTDLTKLWWEGPAFLKENVINYPICDIPDTEIETNRKITNLLCTSEHHQFDYVYLTKYSSLLKLIRVTAYCLKFIKLCKNQTKTKPEPYLTSFELKCARMICIKMSQNTYFKNEIDLLSKGLMLNAKNSRIANLNPFLDTDAILRVGGRLSKSQLCYDQKFPIILSNKCNLTKLIVLDAHRKTLHGGIQLTLNIVNQSYWIVNAKNVVKKVIHLCIPCFKQKAAPKAPFMGNLPEFRLNQNRPFRISGVDYAGPFTLKMFSGRCNRTSKAYICLFICTVTKAIHLELVSDLTTSAFIAAFKRFSSRRGHCRELWSDCGTNFIGASRELDLQFRNAKSNVVKEIAELLANDNTAWNFIPPSSPHFGGLWEAGVKSVKGHLKRVIGQTSLTFEEFYTLLTQVEACVNSRPLTVISSSSDETPLTPGHFLIGEPPVLVIEDNLEDVAMNRLNRWQTIQRMTQHLWKRWQNEYLTTLQHRYKWCVQQPDVELGAVVLVKDERLPPGKWLLGRVIQKHPGSDGITRVVTLQYKNNTFKRPVAKLCPLPLESS